MTNLSYQLNRIHYSPRMQSFFTIGLTLDFWNFTKETEQLKRRVVKASVAASFTAIAESGDLLLVGASNGALVFYNMATESVSVQQLFELQSISQINTFGDAVLVATGRMLYLYSRAGLELTQKSKMEFDS